MTSFYCITIVLFFQSLVELFWHVCIKLHTTAQCHVHAHIFLVCVTACEITFIWFRWNINPPKSNMSILTKLPNCTCSFDDSVCIEYSDGDKNDKIVLGTNRHWTRYMSTSLMYICVSFHYSKYIIVLLKLIYFFCCTRTARRSVLFNLRVE